MELNCCVSIISSRTKCIKKNLESFYKFFNNELKYQVYIYHFDNIYNKDFIDDIHNSIDKNIKFIEIDYGIPKHIKYKEICFIRENQFHRMGYHHMCNFRSNYYIYPKTEYHKYDLCFDFDDDSLWYEKFDNKIINEFVNSDSVILTFNCYKYPVNHRSRKYRKGLCQLVKNYCKKYNIEPKHRWLKELLIIEDNKVEDFFQVNIQCYDTNITKLKIFKIEEYKKFIFEINNSGGIYKYRWGDNEVISLFHDIHFETPVFRINDIKDGCGGVQKYLDPGGLRDITDIAPNVKLPKKYI